MSPELRLYFPETNEGDGLPGNQAAQILTDQKYVNFVSVSKGGQNIRVFSSHPVEEIREDIYEELRNRGLVFLESQDFNLSEGEIENFILN